MFLNDDEVSFDRILHAHVERRGREESGARMICSVATPAGKPKRTASSKKPVADPLLAQVLENVDDDGLRHVWADALQERGDQRGEAIAIQCAATATGLSAAQERTCRYSTHELDDNLIDSQHHSHSLSAPTTGAEPDGPPRAVALKGERTEARSAHR